MTDEDHLHPETVEIIRGSENLENLVLATLSGIRESFDSCLDHIGPSMQVGNVQQWNTISQLKNKGIKLRLITEVTKENLSYCKKMIKHAEVRHIDAAKGNFMICDKKKYLVYITQNEEKLTTQLLYCNITSFVDTQQYLFDNLWSRAIPVRDKIKELELGLDREFIEIIKDPLEIKKLFHSLIKSATYEILLLFSTQNAFYRAESDGLLELLEEVAESGVNARILSTVDDDTMREIRRKKSKNKHAQIHIRYIRRPLENKIMSLVIDQAVSLSVEVIDDSKLSFEESAGSSTYSNSESTVSSHVSIFETLWIQSELEKQNKTKQVYFHMFKGGSIKDEFYNKRWQSVNKE